MYLYINGCHVSQFEDKLNFTGELKSKPLRDLTPKDKVDLENVLMGEALHGESIEDGINSEGQENDAEKGNNVDEDFEEEDDKF